MTIGDGDALVSRIFGDPDIGWRFGLVCDTTTKELQRQAALEWIDDANAHWALHRWGAWAICLRSDHLGKKGELVGFCGFFSADDPIPDHELEHFPTR
jgi:RimJ/RimL family protein N-acetyltransferase